MSDPLDLQAHEQRYDLASCCDTWRPSGLGDRCETCCRPQAAHDHKHALAVVRQQREALETAITGYEEACEYKSEYLVRKHGDIDAALALTRHGKET